MPVQRIVISVAFAAGITALPFSPARAQYYPPCSPFPLTWPFCIAGAAVGTAAAIATVPFRAVAGGPYYDYYGRPYYAPAYYYPPRYRYRRHHYRRH
jgi:hypothetical protein